MADIKTWQERMKAKYGEKWLAHCGTEYFMQAEIADLRAALAQRTATAVQMPADEMKLATLLRAHREAKSFGETVSSARAVLDFTEEHGDARAEEARREADLISDAAITLQGRRIDYLEQKLAAAQRTAGGDAGQRLAQFREWLAATGALPRGGSWIAELEAIVTGRGEPVAVVEAAAQADDWITPQVAQNLDRQYRDGFMAGWDAQLDGNEELFAAVQNRVKPLAEYGAALTAQPRPAETMRSMSDMTPESIAEERAQPTPPDNELVKEALGHIKTLVEFAHEQGFHELGYSPVDVVSRAALRQPGALPDEAEDAARYRFLRNGSWNNHTHPQIREHMMTHVNREALDQTIDAARAAAKQAGEEA